MKKKNGVLFCFMWSVYISFRMFNKSWRKLRSFNAYEGDVINMNLKFDLDVTV